MFVKSPSFKHIFMLKWLISLFNSQLINMQTTQFTNQNNQIKSLMHTTKLIISPKFRNTPKSTHLTSVRASKTLIKKWIQANTKQQPIKIIINRISNITKRDSHLIKALFSCFLFIRIGSESSLECNKETRKIHGTKRNKVNWLKLQTTTGKRESINWLRI